MSKIHTFRDNNRKQIFSISHSLSFKSDSSENSELNELLKESIFKQFIIVFFNTLIYLLFDKNFMGESMNVTVLFTVIDSVCYVVHHKTHDT